MSRNEFDLRRAIRSPLLAGLYDYWASRRGAAAAPSRGDIDPLEMQTWLGNLLLIDCLPADDFRYRLYGTQFVREFGKEMTGRSISELPDAQQTAIRAEYKAARDAARPLHRIYTAEFDLAALIRPRPDARKRATWERLILPLIDEVGAVNMLLVGAYQIETEAAASPAP